LQITFLFLDDDPVAVAERIREPLLRRWESTSDLVPLLAAPFHLVIPFEWERYLP
jgi:hypothetical protein